VPGLILIGIVAGLIAGISPCILPVLPVVLVAGATGDGGISPRRRAVSVVAGVVVSFSAIVLGGSALLSLLGLPQDLLRDAGLVVLGVLGAGLMVPRLGQALERPFARLRVPQPSARAPGFVLGVGLGAVFVPCAGPVLAAISVIGATRRVGLTGVLLTLAFAVGAVIPLFFVALAGDGLVSRVRTLRERAPTVRVVAGAVLVATTLVIGLNLTDGLQRSVPGYTSTLQREVEGTRFAKQQLAAITGNGGGSLSSCRDGDPTLERCGAAPSFKGISSWLNTPDHRSLTLQSLRGKVVLVDFWTYSCINCQRTLPHIEAWYRRYAGDGFVVVGVHTPEFAFEHVVSNVEDAARQLGVRYPIAVDNGYSTWDAYHNQYWPAEYLVDATGQVRHVHFAEGSYGQTESLIRQLLVAAHPTVHLPPPSDVPDRTPQEPTNPETYLGYDRLQYLVGSQPVPDTASRYEFPSSLPLGGYALSGTWTIGAEGSTAGPGARLELSFEAKDVYLVLGGSGTVTVTVDGGRPTTLRLSSVPGLYTLFSSASLDSGMLSIAFSPGVQAYDFTFG
jgi:cytochrome c biogenesis protein CcdA/thiol-disulfide isomerase/thioredoxin